MLGFQLTNDYFLHGNPNTLSYIAFMHLVPGLLVEFEDTPVAHNHTRTKSDSYFLQI